MAKTKFKWILLLEDGTIREGEGNEKALIIAMKTPGLIDGDVIYHGFVSNISSWMCFIR